MQNILPFIIATVIPVFVLYLIYKLDLYKIGEYRLVLMFFIAGGICFVFAFFLNPIPVKEGWIELRKMQLFSAPVLEEILKCSFLILLIRRPSFTYFVDGAIYGFSVGIGFAVFENYSYILHSTSGIELAVARVVSTNLVHASASALVGAAVGFARFDKSFRRTVFIVIGLSFAIGLHILFNTLVVQLKNANGLLLIIVAALIGISALIIIALIIKQGLVNEKRWIEETLGQKDRVTYGEAKVIQNISDLGVLMAPLHKKFGKDRAAQIEKMLLVQARLGILKKAINRNIEQDDRIRIEEKILQLRDEMDQLRRNIGVYAMLYLRNIFPEDAGNIWKQLERVIEDGKDGDYPGVHQVDVWNRLNQKLDQRKDV